MDLPSGTGDFEGAQEPSKSAVLILDSLLGSGASSSQSLNPPGVDGESAATGVAGLGSEVSIFKLVLIDDDSLTFDSDAVTRVAVFLVAPFPFFLLGAYLAWIRANAVR